jgi:glycosyltransferase involved in cell wall biosynthesis
MPERPKIAWSGPFLNASSLAFVNRRLVAALVARGNVDVSLACEPLASEHIPPAYRVFADLRAPFSPGEADVAVVHGFPPRFAAPRGPRYVHVQPWEYGSMPVEWYEALHDDCDDVWTHSTYNRDAYLEAGMLAERVAVVPHGVDSAIFTPNGPKAALGSGDFRFLFVGGTLSRKGIDVLVNAYGRAFSRRDPVVLTIKDMSSANFYKGQTRSEDLRALAQRTDIARIEYVDAIVPDEAMAQLYRASNVLVHPYRGEGFAMPVLEAMACGVAPVVTAGGATDDFVDESVGWRVKSARRNLAAGVAPLPTVGSAWVLEPDADDLAATLRAAYEQRDAVRDRGAAAAERASEWTWDRAAAIAERRFEVILARAAVPPKRRHRAYAASDRDLASIAIELFARIGPGNATFYGDSPVASLLERGMLWRRAAPDEAAVDLANDPAGHPRVVLQPPAARVLDGYACVAATDEGSLFVRDDLVAAAGFSPLLAAVR